MARAIRAARCAARIFRDSVCNVSVARTRPLDGLSELSARRHGRRLVFRTTSELAGQRSPVAAFVCLMADAIRRRGVSAYGARMKKHRSILGYLSMFVGLALIVFAAYWSSGAKSSSALHGATAVASAVTGGVLTLVVSRRMLTSPTE
jgi:hypothetical protein